MSEQQKQFWTTFEKAGLENYAMNTKILGASGEQQAAEFLKEKGYKNFVSHNVVCFKDSVSVKRQPT